VKEIQALRFISNSLTQHAKSPSIREIQRELGYGSPRSAALILDSLIRNRRVQRRANGKLKIINDLIDKKSRARTVPIPLVGTAPCGQPLLAEENIEAVIPVSVTLAKPPHRYFLLRARGDSMNQAGISANDLVLVRQQRSAENGSIVVAVIDDEATIKEYKRTKTAVVLKPKSTSTEHQPIILSRNFHIQGIVIRTISDGA
jgi:repressor LexA